jgi:CubicO group peptidase (beta-lactamase class C family)
MRGRGAAAALCVLRDGEVLLDLAVGCAPDALFWIFSASKPFVALSVHLLAQRGALALDDPVAAHWPDFGGYAKEAVTIRHVLQHRAGLPVARGRAADALTMASPARSVRAVERARPRYRPGAVPAYHWVTYGVILGELVRRVAGEPVDRFLRAEVLEPFGLRDTYLGLPDAQWPRHVPLRGVGLPGRVTQAVVNRRSTRSAVIPAAGISCTARDLARFYASLLAGSSVFAPETLAAARFPSCSPGEVDRFLRLPVRWAQGFQLGGPDSTPMGRTSSPLTFGHNGSHCCIGWADPTRRLAFAYLTDRIAADPSGSVHFGHVADAVLSAVQPDPVDV